MESSEVEFDLSELIVDEATDKALASSITIDARPVRDAEGDRALEIKISTRGMTQEMAISILHAAQHIVAENWEAGNDDSE